MLLSPRAMFQSSWTSFVLSTVLAASSFVSAAAAPRLIETSQLLPKYDYIIVGGGTAGLTIADRLSEDPSTNVLVLEAGDFGVTDAILTVSYINKTLLDLEPMFWPGLFSVPQINLNNASIVIGIARVVGGGSAVNAMYTVRGTAADYDRWDQLFELDGQKSKVSWSWHAMLPYFKKGLHFTPPPPKITSMFDSMKYDPSYWGNTSEIHAGWPDFYWPGVTPLVEAFKEIEGVEFPADSGAGQTGVYWFPTFLDPRPLTRSYAETGHYANVNLTRSNYHLLINTLVRQILIDDSLIARGVQFPSANSTLLNVIASKEVILSAGAVHSPYLLQLSGVGPKSLLEAGGIKVRVDLPGVGQNFQDHSSVTALNITLQGIQSLHPNPDDMLPGNPLYTLANEEWAANRSGPYSIAVSNLAAWLPFPVVSNNSEALATKLEQQDFGSILPPGSDKTIVAGYEAQMKVLATQMRTKNTTFVRVQLQADSGAEGPVLMQPLSRGTININTADPWNTEPIVDFRALSNPVESDLFVEFIRFIRKYSFQTSLATTFTPVEYLPGSNVTSEQGLKAFIASALSPTDYHPVGTCSMMPRELGGVVDQELRVYGLKNLRVVDGSVIPMLPGANTCQPIYAIAEKAADLINGVEWD